jgi:hypothetical protein
MYRFEHLGQHIEAGIETFEHGLEHITHSSVRQDGIRWFQTLRYPE